MRARGIVKWYNEAKGFGFIDKGEDPDVFVHFNAIQPNGYRTLAEGAVVEFDIVDGKKGPQAENVEVVGQSAIVGGGGVQAGTKKG